MKQVLKLCEVGKTQFQKLRLRQHLRKHARISFPLEVLDPHSIILNNEITQNPLLNLVRLLFFDWHCRLGLLDLIWLPPYRLSYFDDHRIEPSDQRTINHSTSTPLIKAKIDTVSEKKFVHWSSCLHDMIVGGC